MEKNGFVRRNVVRLRETLSLSTFSHLPVFLLALGMVLVLPLSASAEDRLVVEDAEENETFVVEDTGWIHSAKGYYANGAAEGMSVGAPLILGQTAMESGFNRGLVITDVNPSNFNNVYIGWNREGDNGASAYSFLQIYAVQEGVSFRDIILGYKDRSYIGIGTDTVPQYPLEMYSGAYCSEGGTWYDASSREYKQNIQDLTADEAMVTLKDLNPVKFNYKKTPDEQSLGFIAEDVPDLVATKDRKGMSSMDVVALLTKVVQEQQKTIAELSRKMSELERELKLKNDVAMVDTDLFRPVVK